MACLCLQNNHCHLRLRAWIALLAGVTLLAAVGVGAGRGWSTPPAAESPPAVTAPLSGASLQTLVFLHRGDAVLPGAGQP